MKIFAPMNTDDELDDLVFSSESEKVFESDNNEGVCHKDTTNTIIDISNDPQTSEDIEYDTFTSILDIEKDVSLSEDTEIYNNNTEDFEYLDLASDVPDDNINEEILIADGITSSKQEEYDNINTRVDCKEGATAEQDSNKRQKLNSTLECKEVNTSTREYLDEKNNDTEEFAHSRNYKTLPCRNLDTLEEKCLDLNLNANVLETSLFKTGSNKKIHINKLICPKFVSAYTKGPMRCYNRPEKGHVSSEMAEKQAYMYLYEKMKEHFTKVDNEMLKIQFRWSYLHLYEENLLDNIVEAISLIKRNIEHRLGSEYSILRRIVEGDETPLRYMIVLVLSVNKNIIEVYDGYFSVKVELDKLLEEHFKIKGIKFGTKIKLFGCKYLLSSNKSIFEINEDEVVLKAFYNSFNISFPNRKLGIRKKISFLRNIKDIQKNGGIISCIKGLVTRIIERKYVVQVKDYRSKVDDLEKEFEKIQDLLDKSDADITQEDIKVRRYVKFILKDETGECLITSWIFSNEIICHKELIFCGLIPVESALGLHLTTTRYTYLKIKET